MGKIITTVRGDIAPEALGFCQAHEHLYAAKGPASASNPALTIDDIRKSTADAEAYRQAGGSAVVDAGPVFAGRGAKALKAISEAADIHVVASTGFHKFMFYGRYNDLLDWDEEQLAELFASEIETGMYAEAFYTQEPARTDIRAGLIKTALEPDFTDVHKKFFAAAVSAAKRTGTSVLIHTDKGSDPLALLDFLTIGGLPAERQIYCHLDRTTADISVHKEIAKAGAYLEYDTVARGKYHSDEAEAEILLAMDGAGYRDRILMALDTTRERLAGYGGFPGLGFILKDFIPMLTQYGFDEGFVRAVFVENPASALARFDKGASDSHNQCVNEKL